MRRITVLVLVCGLAACGGHDVWQENPVPPTVQPDPTVPPQPVVPLPSALQSVVSHVQLPDSGAVGLDLDGDGLVDNQIGRLLGELKAMLGLELQSTLDQQMAAGKALVLYDLRARSLLDDGQVELRAYIGRDLDGDPTDNYTGKEPFAVTAGVMDRVVLPGAINGQQLASSSQRGFVSLPFLSATTVLPLRVAAIRATVGPDGMQHGVLAGAIPLTEAVNRLAPVLAAELDRLYRLPDLGATMTQAFRVLLDGDADGSITVQELTTSNAFGFLLHSADIDSDGDGTPDAISFGLNFRSTPCQIQLP